MKKLFLFIAAVAISLPGCKKINEELDALGSRLDKLEQESIPCIDEQIVAINATLSKHDIMDKELKSYIDHLTATASNLQEQINSVNSKIGMVKEELKDEIASTNSELNGEIAAAKTYVLTQLEALETELKTELAQINATIADLQVKDSELDDKITELKSYVDTELGKTTDWVYATFATLDQYNMLVTEVATIKEQIKAINENITSLETRLTTKINVDIATTVAILNAEVQQKIKDITEAYTIAIKTAKEEITVAYTLAIQTAISNLDISLKAWVGEQLANYYTIAEIDAKITVLQNAITGGDVVLQKELKSLKSQLETTATEITSAYKKAIEEAININNGVVDTKIADEIAAVNQRITNEVATINAKIAEIESRLDNVEAKIAELLARIQSVSYIPTYSDGKATVKYNGGVSQVLLDFKISPKECVAELGNVWKDVLKVEAVYTQTRSVSFVELQIVKCEVDTITGVVSIIASCSNLSTGFFAGTQEASAALVISDSNNSITSEYVPMTAKEVSDEELEDDILSSIPKNQIWYTTKDDSKIFPNITDVTVFGAVLTSNVYKNGSGVLTFDDTVTKIGNEAFKDCSSLTSISIPNSVTEIGNEAFKNCSSLTSISIPNSVNEIGYSAFYYCRNLAGDLVIPNGITKIYSSTFYHCESLTSLTIPDSVTSIGERAFEYCNKLESVYYNGDLSAWCKINFQNAYNQGQTTANPLYNGAKLFINNTELTELIIPSDISYIKGTVFSGCKSLKSVTLHDNITEVSQYCFYNCRNLTSVTIPNSVTKIGSSAFGNCSSLTSVTIPDSVTEIGSSAFDYCRLLTSLTIGNSVTKIGGWAFGNCSSLTSVTIPDSVTEIEFGAFCGCSNLQNVYCRAQTPPSLEGVWDQEGDYFYGPFDEWVKDFIIYIPAKSYAIYYQYTDVTEYLDKSNWSMYKSYLVPYNFE